MILLVAAAFADPPAPSGWSSSASGGATVYLSGLAELRLYPAEPAGDGLAPWFRARLARGIRGVTVGGFGPPEIDEHGVATAMSAGVRSGDRILAVVFGCDARGGTARYAELLVPLDPTAVERAAKAAATVIAEACAAPAGPVAAAAPPPRTTPPPAPPPAPAAAPERPAGFRYAVAPGHGLDPAQIHAVLYSWEQVYEIGGLMLREEVYLLLKDGTARKGLPPVPPAEFDAAAERAGDPPRWGRWKAGADGLLVSIGGGAYTAPPGQMRRYPGRPGERLDREFIGASSYEIPGGAGSWSRWGIRFQPDGRFRVWHTGGTGGSVGEGADRVVTGGVWDDAGSASSVSGPGFGGGSTSRTGTADADLSGTYRIDGWSLELRFDSGRVSRTFFYTDEARERVWYEDGEMFVPSR